jgi:hypothetical protein
MTPRLPLTLAALWLAVCAVPYAARAAGPDATASLPSWLTSQQPLPPLPGGELPPLGPLEEPVLPPELEEPPALPHEQWIDPAADAASECCPPASACCVPAYGWQFLPQGLIYRTYLAGVKESRFRSVWNNERDDGNIWDITLGGQVPILRYGTQGDVRPEGWQLGIEGAGQVRLDTDVERDVNATDYRFGIPLTWGNATYQQKFAYYHLSSHVGDEFLLRTPGFNRVNYSRDVLVWGHSLYLSETLRLYGEAGYGVFVDVSEPWEFQAGVDWAPAGCTGRRGAPFAAVNGHIREEVDYSGNFAVQSGWCWRRSPATGLLRVGVEYYNGKDDQFSFFNESVEKVGAGIWYDY